MSKTIVGSDIIYSMVRLKNSYLSDRCIWGICKHNSAVNGSNRLPRGSCITPDMHALNLPKYYRPKN